MRRRLFVLAMGATTLGSGLLVILWLSRHQASEPDTAWLSDEAPSQRDPLIWAAALLVLGEVAALAGTLHWFGAAPLGDVEAAEAPVALEQAA